MGRTSVPRCYYCYTAIKFDPKVRSPNGKLIPLDKDGKTKHNCPNSPYNKKKIEPINRQTQTVTRRGE